MIWLLVALVVVATAAIAAAVLLLPAGVSAYKIRRSILHLDRIQSTAQMKLNGKLLERQWHKGT